MEKALISKLNRGIKKYEPHQEITIFDNGLPLETTFYRVTDFQDNTICFLLKAISGTKIKLSYSYDTEKVKYVIDDSEAVIADLFSNRHIRSILFYSWDFMYRHEHELDEFNELMHKKCPVPILRTSSSGEYQNKYFKIDSVTIGNNTIRMSGILSICGRDYFGQPTIATCVHYFRKDTFMWSYKVAGVDITKESQERTESIATIDPFAGNLFRIQTELDNQHYCQTENNNDKYNELTKSILKKLDNFEFHVFSPRTDNIWVDTILSFIVKRVVEVNDAEIVFEICDTDSPSSTLVYDRTFQGLYRKKRKTYSKKKTEFEFIHNSNGNIDKFLNIIRLIETYTKD